MGAERKSQYLDPKAKLATAYHEVSNGVFISERLIIFYSRADMHWSRFTRKEQCLFIRLRAFLGDMRWATWVTRFLYPWMAV